MIVYKNEAVTLSPRTLRVSSLGKTIWERNRTAKTTEICVDVAAKGRDDLVTRTTVVYDVQRFVPLRQTVAMVTAKGARDIMKETYECEVINGVTLPVQVLGERSSSEKVDGTNVGFTRQYDWRLDWRSVNEGIPQEIEIGPQSLLDTEKLLKLLTPDAVP